MKDEDAGCWMKNSFVAKAFIVKDALGCGLKQKANKVLSSSLLFHLMALSLCKNMEKLSCDHHLPLNFFKSNISKYFHFHCLF